MFGHLHKSGFATSQLNTLKLFTYTSFMFTGYFDARGHQAEERVLTAAGFVAEQDQWEHFERN